MQTKKVLITGAGSYIGTAFETWVEEHCDEIKTHTLSLRDENWETYDFQGYDVVFHVVGIAHADVGSVTEEEKAQYYKVNTDLTIKCAQKAKAEGIKQFIFMSSIIVYGESAGIGTSKVITRDTPLMPSNFYGDSKVKAEKGLQELEDDFFKVVILRPPMIYGKGSKGNYPLLAKIADRFPLFPDVKNERSMLYIGNLCKFITLMIEKEERGIFFPQNTEYVQTSKMVMQIAATHEKKIHLTKIFNPVLKIMGRLGGRLGGLVNKAFGNLTYEKSMSEYREEYRLYNFQESVQLTENRSG